MSKQIRIVRSQPEPKKQEEIDTTPPKPRSTDTETILDETDDLLDEIDACLEEILLVSTKEMS